MPHLPPDRLSAHWRMLAEASRSEEAKAAYTACADKLEASLDYKAAEGARHHRRHTDSQDVPEIPAEVVLKEDDKADLDVLLASYPGRVWMNYTAQYNRLHSLQRKPSMTNLIEAMGDAIEREKGKP